jgi:hypothetical protein
MLVSVFVVVMEGGVRVVVVLQFFVIAAAAAATAPAVVYCQCDRDHVLLPMYQRHLRCGEWSSPHSAVLWMPSFPSRHLDIGLNFVVEFWIVSLRTGGF